MKVYCFECRKHTNHRIIAEEKVHTDPDCPVIYGETHYFCQCQGCDTHVYAISSWNEEHFDPRTREVELTWKTYPHSEGERESVTNTYDFPPKIRTLYLEIVDAINAQLPVLAAIGLRAMIEAICKERGVSAPNLQALIDGLAANGILTSAQADILHSHRFLGNVAAHEAVPAKPAELVAALEIAENMLRLIYTIPKLSQQITTGRKP